MEGEQFIRPANPVVYPDHKRSSAQSPCEVKSRMPPESYCGQLDDLVATYGRDCASKSDDGHYLGWLEGGSVRRFRLRVYRSGRVSPPSNR